MGLEYALRRARPAHHGAVAARPLHPIRRRTDARQHPISRPAALARQVRRSAARLPGVHRERLQSAPDQPRLDPAALAPTRPTPPAIQPNYLATEEDRRVAADALRVARRIVRAAGAARASSRWSIMPGARCRRSTRTLAKAAGDVGTTIFHPVGTAQDGRRRRSAWPWWTSGCACAASRGLRVIDASVDADDHLRQYQFADHDDRREGRGDDPGGCQGAACRSTVYPAGPRQGRVKMSGDEAG